MTHTIHARLFIGLAALALLLNAARPLGAQTLPAGPQVLTFFSDVDDTDQPYGLYLQRNFDAGRKYPLVVMLHGAGSNHRLALRRVFGKSNLAGETDVEATRSFPPWPDVGVIVVAPFARGTMGYQGIAEKDVLDVLEDVRRRFPIDDDRVYLTGLSMGGGGTLWLGLTRPDLWAAIAPVCPAPPPGTENVAANALNVPVRIFQGGADPVVRPEGVRAWVKRLEDAGARVEYTEYPGVLHNSWEAAYRDGAIFDWLAKFRRNRFPDRVRFVSSRYASRRAYWVELDRLTPGTPASIDARFIGPNRIEIESASLGAFTLLVEEHPQHDASRATDLRIDGQSLTVPAAGALSFVRNAGTWRIGRYQPPPEAKQAGREGPLSEVIAARHVYVYGTSGKPSDEELRARRQTAERAADWSAYRGPFLGRVMVFPRVVADTDVRPSDLESANLILFGTKETNTVVAGLADRLPLHLTALEGYGLLYVFPVDGRYVAVSAGRPWWETEGDGGAVPGPANAAGRPRAAFSFLGSTQGALTGLGDYVLFKGSLDHIVVQGRFDEQWQLPATDAATLAATGVVAIATAGARNQP
jgi:poly(3-hydroxybutyrate) depolymerase